MFEDQQPVYEWNILAQIIELFTSGSSDSIKKISGLCEQLQLKNQRINIFFKELSFFECEPTFIA